MHRVNPFLLKNWFDSSLELVEALREDELFGVIAVSGITFTFAILE